MLFKTEFDQQSTVQKRSAKMVRGLENHVCRIRPSERVSYQCQMRQCFGFCSCPVVSCTQGRNGLSCLLWLYLQVSGVPSTSSQHTWAAATQSCLHPQLPLLNPAWADTPNFFSYYFLVLICEPPFLLILDPKTAVRKRSECFSAKDVENHEMYERQFLRYWP